jgi:translation initiation factor 2 alpha subunit (eIF-2alpha)
MNKYNELEEGQIVLCTVEKIVGTTVFVKIEENKEGTITTSEISPGRIRNLRDYVVPGKKIVCKILRISGDKIYLSLRRVKQSEKKELLERVSKEKSYKAILKTVLKDNSKEIIQKINEEYPLIEFFEELKGNSKLIEKFVDKKNSEKIIKILETKKEKPKEIRQNFKLSSKSSEGINIIKEILKESCKDTDCELSYLAAGKYRLSITGNEFKKLKTDSNKTLDFIEKQARKKNCSFEMKKN